MVMAVVLLQVPVLRTTTTITGIRIRMSALTYAIINRSLQTLPLGKKQLQYIGALVSCNGEGDPNEAKG